MRTMFSKRTAWDVVESDFARQIRERRARGATLLDLTRSNPTVCGLGPREDEVLAPLENVEALRYDPDPFGRPAAREAIARYYDDHGAAVSPDQIVLTASTSEAYSHLFRLLCDPGDEVLIAQPSYPLFDYLADLSDVRLRPYRLFYDFGWWIDFADLERAITGRTRALVVVHPNNPTGHATSHAERLRLEEICARRGIALIVDEVFLDYSLDSPGAEPVRSFAAGESGALSFVLSGLSKVVALPQMKVGWIVVLGPREVQREALGRLEVIADTFLSVNTPAQAALPRWLAHRTGIQAEIGARLRANLAALREQRLDVLRVDAGWSAVVRLPSISDGRSPAERLLKLGVLVHPGTFYGLCEGSRVVVSLLPPLEEFSEGAAVMAAMVREDAGEPDER